MQQLKEKIIQIIQTKGPMPLEEYISLCLFDPIDGYYTTKEPFGCEGDYITSPEISQMFGELIAAWLLNVWNNLGQANQVTIAEIGPGRGTLMKDVVRVFSKLSPDLTKKILWTFVEISPRLQKIQSATLKEYDLNISWVETIEKIEHKECLLVFANEWLDAVPLQQFMYKNGHWEKRYITLNPHHQLVYTSTPCATDAIPKQIKAFEGDMIEIAPERKLMVQQIVKKIKKNKGAFLLFDYGYEHSQIGDTFQAIYKKKFSDPLLHPGQSDLTSHVDFETLKICLTENGIEPFLTNQGSFLLALGLRERMLQLSQKLNLVERLALEKQADRLSHKTQMGCLFKVLGCSWPFMPLPGFTDARKK